MAARSIPKKNRRGDDEYTTEERKPTPTASSLKQSKEWIKVKCAARETLEQSGWVDSIRHICLMKNQASSDEIPKQSVLVSRVQSDAKARVPDHIKADILQKIKSLLLVQQQQLQRQKDEDPSRDGT